jgi:hypothetical protein
MCPTPRLADELRISQGSRIHAMRPPPAMPTNSPACTCHHHATDRETPLVFRPEGHVDDPSMPEACRSPRIDPPPAPPFCSNFDWLHRANRVLPPRLAEELRTFHCTAGRKRTPLFFQPACWKDTLIIHSECRVTSHVLVCL